MSAFVPSRKVFMCIGNRGGEIFSVLKCHVLCILCAQVNTILACGHIETLLKRPSTIRSITSREMVSIRVDTFTYITCKLCIIHDTNVLGTLR